MKIKGFFSLAVLGLLMACGGNPSETLVTDLEKTWKDFQSLAKPAQAGNSEAYIKLRSASKRLSDLWAKKLDLEKAGAFTPAQLQRLGALGQIP